MESAPERTKLIVLEAGIQPLLDLGEIWSYRDLLWFLVWRDIKVRYKQTVLGVAWVVLQPALAVLVFTVIFGWLLKVPSKEVPYPLLACAALLPWGYFSAAVTRGAISLVSNAHLVSKVYFPRVIIPLAASLAALVDLMLSFSVLLVLMLFYGRTPGWSMLGVLPLVAFAWCAAVGWGIGLAALQVRYRDVGHLLPFTIQIWMYLTPVVYGLDSVPDRYHMLLSINPMTVVVEGFRSASLGMSSSVSTPMVLVSVAMVVVTLLTGLAYHRATERTFADVI